MSVRYGSKSLFARCSMCTLYGDASLLLGRSAAAFVSEKLNLGQPMQGTNADTRFGFFNLGFPILRRLSACPLTITSVER